MTSTNPDANGDTARLATALERLSAHRFVRIHNSTLALMWYQFLRGMAFGFGTVVGATLVVSAVVLLLSQIELIPIIGSFATELIQEIQTPR